MGIPTLRDTAEKPYKPRRFLLPTAESCRILRVMKFSPRLLHAALAVHGVTGRQLAASAGVNASTVERALNGSFVPRQGTVKALADALGISPLALYADDAEVVAR